MAKIYGFDIETTNLSADFGFMICACVRDFELNKTTTFRIDDYKGFKLDRTDDFYLVRDLRDKLEEADVICGHYSSRFDLPYLNSRLLFHDTHVVPPIPHIDTWRIARNRLAMTRNSLASLAEFFNGHNEKTHVDKQIWIRASAGHRDAIDYIVDHCQKDVLVLQDVYEVIRVLAHDHPNVNLASTNFVNKTDPQCPICGSEHLQKRGTIIAKTRISQRYHCRNCGAWSRGRPQPIKAEAPR